MAKTATGARGAECLRKGVGTVTIHLDGNPAEETLRYIADQIENGMTSGYYPTWGVSE